VGARGGNLRLLFANTCGITTVHGDGTGNTSRAWSKQGQLVRLADDLDVVLVGLADTHHGLTPGGKLERVTLGSKWAHAADCPRTGSDRRNGGTGGTALLAREHHTIIPIDISWEADRVSTTAGVLHLTEDRTLAICILYSPPLRAGDSPPDLRPLFAQLSAAGTGGALVVGDFNAAGSWESALDIALEDAHAVPLDHPESNPTYQSGDGRGTTPDRAFYIPPPGNGDCWVPAPEATDTPIAVPVGDVLEKHRALLVTLPIGNAEAASKAPKRQPRLRLPTSSGGWADLDEALRHRYRLDTRQFDPTTALGHRANLELLESVHVWLRNRLRPGRATGASGGSNAKDTPACDA